MTADDSADTKPAKKKAAKPADKSTAQKTEAANSAAAGTADDVIDAQVISEAQAPEEPIKMAEPPLAEQQGVLARIGAGWLVAILAITFIAGLIAAPYASRSLAQLGLIPAPATPEATQQPISLPLDALNPEALDQVSSDITALREEIASQATDIARLEDALANAQRDRPATASPPPVDVTLLNRINSLQGDVESLTRTIANTAAAGDTAAASGAEIVTLRSSLATLTAEVESLTSRLATSEAITRALEAGAVSSTPRGRLYLRLNALEDRLAEGQPIGAAVQDLLPDIAVLPTIDQSQLAEPLAVLTAMPGGVKTSGVIKQQFYALLPQLTKAADQDDGSLVAGLFSVRRVDGQAQGADAVISQAERAMNGDDIAAAYGILVDRLEGSPRELMEPWLESTKAYLDAYAAVDLLRRKLLDNPAFQDGTGRGGR